MAKIAFPGEPDGYRKAREALLEKEIALRGMVEEVAKARAALPLGGPVPEDYAFQTVQDGGVAEITLSQLFRGDAPSLIIYSLMYGRAQTRPCPMCTSFIDYIDGGVPHHAQRAGFAVCAAAPIEELADFAASRGWTKTRLISSAGNTYNRDYLAEDADRKQLPMMNVFTRRDGVIHHFWGSEMMHAGLTRHIDMMWPLWNLLDLLPEGRGQDWHPALSYDETAR